MLLCSLTENMGNERDMLLLQPRQKTIKFVARALTSDKECSTNCIYAADFVAMSR